jgi:lipopolysaccharide/colanic/teichoic acid biosynthesis glycosyltransferase
MTSNGDESIGGVSGATVRNGIIPAFGLDERVKRAFDIVAATMGLIILSPILLITSIAIKLDSQGPIFIRETLYGYSNRAIQVLKFRVMTTCVEGNRINPRVTQVGQIVSQAGIDELPQLFNVLRGEMSIVGRRNVHCWRGSLNRDDVIGGEWE